MKKHTAVEWLVMKWATQGTLHSSDITKAIEMEKEQILESFTEGCFAESWVLKSAEKYYNETFGDK